MVKMKTWAERIIKILFVLFILYFLWIIYLADAGYNVEKNIPSTPGFTKMKKKSNL